MPDRYFYQEKVEQVKTLINQHKALSIGIAVGLFICFLIVIFAEVSPGRTRPTSNSPFAPTTTIINPQNSSSPENKRIYFAKSVATTKKDGIPKVEIYSGDYTGNNVRLEGKLDGLAKQIQPLPSSTYLYIGDLGFLERGNHIDKFDAAQNKSSKVYSASSGYQIERYLLLPDKNSLIIWEETIGSTTTGSSRIVYFPIDNPAAKKILLQETLGDQTKYPIFFSSQTQLVYLDSYSVNRNGKSRSIFSLSLDGKLTPVSQLSLNGYSNEPVLSPDGARLAYTSYNPATKVKLPAPPVPNQIFREAVRNPNQLKIIDLTTGESTMLIENLEGNIFDNLLFSYDGKSIIYRTLKINPNRTTKPLAYNIINIEDKRGSTFADNPNGVFLEQINDTTALFAVRSDMTESLGGTNSAFSQIIRSIYTYKSTTNLYTKILSDDNIQILGIE